MKKLFTLALAALSMTACKKANTGEEWMALVGTYTYDGSYGIYSYRFNPQTGESKRLDSLAMVNPSYLTISEDGQRVYAVCETNDERASLNIIGLDANGSMNLLQTVPTFGGDPCYVASNGALAVTANYSGGSMSVFPLSEQGTQAGQAVLFQGATGGPDLSRQNRPHVHCACFTPDGEYILATDFSADRILSFCVADKDVTPNGIASDVSADSGPRHLVFSRDGRFAYLMSELSGNVTVFRYAEGRLESLQEIVSDSVGARGGADLRLSPDSKFLYSSNRLQAEGIAIFAVDSVTGLLTRIGYQPTGAHPRMFNITPDGQFLLCCCRDSDKIQVFRRNTATGLLTDTRQDIRVSKPVCVQFAD